MEQKWKRSGAGGGHAHWTGFGTGSNNKRGREFAEKRVDHDQCDPANDNNDKGGGRMKRNSGLEVFLVECSSIRSSRSLADSAISETAAI